jgi:hypothetical protein
MDMIEIINIVEITIELEEEKIIEEGVKIITIINIIIIIIIMIGKKITVIMKIDIIIKESPLCII